MSLTDGSGLSAADVAAVTGNGGFGNGFGGDGAWWLLVLFLFAFNGNWGNGYGNNGFAQAEIAANARQMADMNQNFALQSQFADCCCENRLASADLKYTIATENCADRTALNEGIRDILESQNNGIQRILDTMCQDKIDAKNERIADLERQLTMANLAASQGAQTAAILANNEAQTNALEQYLAPVPRPAYIVQNPNGCGCNSVNACGCGCGSF